MNDTHDFHPHAFDIASTESDTEYYNKHISTPLLDQGGYKAIEALYHTLIQKSDTIIDLMCGANSHIPTHTPYQNLIGIDLNEHALQQNPQLTQRIVQDINQNPLLPFPDHYADFFCLCCVVEYLRKPFLLLEECLRILKPNGRIIISFSTRFIPQRAIALWQALDNSDRQKFIKILLTRSGFTDIDQGEVHPPANHPLWHYSIYSIIASKPAT